ncbi:peptidoglycan-binding protein [Aestuariivirga sp.]|uniref:peptidoglycan-binding protein n=1 Tax=Aestuariivirga sp. TaxID=2650926 RepID=UPI0039E3F397
MKPGIPWSVKGIEPEVREAAKDAAKRSGMTLGEWLNTMILDQSEAAGAGEEAPKQGVREEISATAPKADRAVTDDTTMRLEDIAQQLSRLARRDQEAATIGSFEPQERGGDREAMNRILTRVENNERQAVEAFTAVNERLSVLGRQIAVTARPRAFERPEDVPGFPALESAIRNVVSHIEQSETGVHAQLQAMQDKLSSLAQRTANAMSEDVLQSTPVIASLESRLAGLADRMQRSEQAAQNQGLPDIVRRELDGLAHRMESLREDSRNWAEDARSSATAMAQRDLHDLETRVLSLLKDAQASFANQPPPAELQRLRAEIGNIHQRIDDQQAGVASDSDVQALSLAVEQLSARVAQGPDLRPLADMDRRIGDVAQRLEQVQQSNRSMPQFGDLERRIAELDHRLSEAEIHTGNPDALAAFEQQLEAVNDRIGRSEQQLGHLATIERSISQLFESVEQSKTAAREAAEDAASRVAERFLGSREHTMDGPTPEMAALEEGLRAVRESAAASDQRSQDTLSAVHETLEQIVAKLAELETSAAGHQLAMSMMQTAPAEPVWAAPEPEQVHASAPVFDPVPPAPEPVMPFAADSPAAAAELPKAPEPDFTQPSLLDGEVDYLALARRAHQAALEKTPAITAENRKTLKPRGLKGLSLKVPFLKASKIGAAKLKADAAPDAPKPVPPIKPAPASKEAMRRKLVYAAIAALLVVSASLFVGQKLLKSQPTPKQTTSVETPAPLAAPIALNTPVVTDTVVAPAAVTVATNDAKDGLNVSDALVTASLPTKANSASVASLVADTSQAAAPVKQLPAEIGNQALRDAANAGDPVAEFVVATRFMDGNTVAQDYASAAYWYQKSAEQGLAPSAYRVATLYERGKGVAQDAVLALKWYEQAAAAGNVKSMHNAAVIASGSDAGTPNFDKAFRWFSEAAKRGLKDSQFNLAVLYERGLGTGIDTGEAYFWYMQAAKQGDTDAANRAAELAKKMDPGAMQKMTARIAAWAPDVSVDFANVVAVNNPAWSAEASAPMQEEPPSASASSEATPILKAQQLLSKLGYNVGTPDGQMGARTAAAVRLFQLQSGLKVTGDINPDLIAAMEAKAG